MIFTEADSCKLYRLNRKIENNTATVIECCIAVQLSIRKNAVFKLTGERR